MKPLPIGEARKRLPELVRKVASGHAPIPIGRRGRCEVILAPAAMAADAVARRPLQGLVQIVGSWDEVKQTRRAIRRDIEASLDDPTGLFTYDTRFLSRWVLTIDGQRLD